MINQIKVGIVGYGIVGQKRRYWIDAHENMKTIAVCDTRFDDHGEMLPVEELSYNYIDIEKNSSRNFYSGTLNSGVSFYNNYEMLVDENELDALFVCVPNYLAPEITIFGLQNELNVFCEKPPGRAINDILKVIKIEKKHPKLKLKYGFNHRYHYSIIEAKRIIDSGELGKIINLRGIYGKSSLVTFPEGWRANVTIAGGGILLDQGIHMIDMLRYLSGDFDEIKSFVSNSFWSHNVEDNAYALLKNNKSGVIAMVHSTATQWQHKFSLEISLEKGTIKLSGILSGSKSYGSETLILILRDDKSSEDTQTIYNYLYDDSWKFEIEEFANCILYNKPVTNGTSYDALKVMEMVFSIYKADESWWQYFENNN